MTDIIAECARLGYERHPHHTLSPAGSLATWVDMPWSALTERQRQRYIADAMEWFSDAATLGVLNETGINAIKEMKK